MSVIEGLEPGIVWKHFDEIRKIPRCSKHEEKIREYIVNFAKKLNLEYKVDKAGNVVIRKAASPGMENKPIVVLQGHMDMVCEKNANVEHDFSKDPIKLVKKDDVLTADGTTLGADNGIGLAIMLAILEDKNLKHGPIEALFTVDEETGLTGAFAIQPDFLKGRIMLNLDSEDFGVITIGSAGGGGSKIELPLERQKSGKESKSFTIKVTGLRGGHSGVDIHEQRGNAIKILARLLWKAMQSYNVFVSDIRGGDKHNAIPREAIALVSLDEKNASDFISSLENEAKDIANEIKSIDPNFTLKIEEAKDIEDVLDKDSTSKLINLLYSLPHGVDKMSYDVPGLVETSTNLAKISMEKNKAVIEMSSRSATKSELEDMRSRIKAIANLAGGKTTEDEPYPGWKPNLDSKILALAKKVFKEMYGDEPKVEAIHAGLECGIIGEKFPGMDMISIGPTIKYPHSPDEQVEISTVDKFYKYVLKILENI